MARRAGVVPFSLSSATLDNQPPPAHHGSPVPRGHQHSQSHSSTISNSSTGAPSSRYGRSTPASSRPMSGSSASGGGSARSIAARRESTPRSVPPASPSDGLALAAIQGGMAMGMGMSRGSQLLPSVAEMTTGVSPYSTPAYAISMSMPMGGGAYGTSSPGPLLPALGFTGGPRPDVKRRGSPEVGSRETSRRRQ